MLKKIVVLLSLSAFALLAVACDRSAVAGIPSATQLNELTDEQNDSLCEHLKNEFTQIQEDDQLKQGMCIVMGSFAAAFAGFGGEDAPPPAEACQSAYDECLTEDLTDEDEDFDEFCLSAEDRQCEATVAEFAACFSAMFEWGFGPIRDLSGMTCEEATSEDGGERLQAAMTNMEGLGGDEFPDIPACQALREKCPDLS